MMQSKKTNKKKKLLLFDIDGTLLAATKDSIMFWRHRMVEVFSRVYDKDLPIDFSLEKVNGKLERGYFRELADMVGIPKDEFDAKFRDASELFHTLLRDLMHQEKVIYSRIDDACSLVDGVLRQDAAHLGLITGNVEKNAWLKLDAIGLREHFSFGGFGDVIEDRGELVVDTIRRAKEHFGVDFAATDVVVIGDTVHDIRSAKFAGAIAIAVSTGFTDSHEKLEAEGADLVVRSLLDERVVELVGLQQIDKVTK